VSAKEEPTAYEIDVWLDSEPPNPADARDATHFRRIIGARQAADAAQDELRAAVQAAREAGDSWVMIGAALGTSRQAARQQFGD
jgi:hypothetical protein